METLKYLFKKEIVVSRKTATGAYLKDKIITHGVAICN